MRLHDLLLLALRNSLRNGVKALLCAGAVCIGICSICTVRGVGGAAERAIGAELDELGLSGMMFYGEQTAPIDGEAVQAAAAVQGVAAAMPLLYQSGSLRLRSTTMSAALCGVDENLAEIFSVRLLYGRLPGAGDVRAANSCLVLDEQTARSVYRRANVVGKTAALTVNGVTADFEIVGVIRSQKRGLETLIGGSLPCVLYLPYTTLQTFHSENGKELLAVAAEKTADEQRVAAAVRRRLKQEYAVDFSFENLDRYAGSFRRVTRTLAWLISGVAGISIVVGGLGVMNAMVAVVDERVGEIGVWLALGARRRSIAACYLLEALLICLAGGVAGVTLSWAALEILERAFGLALTVRWGDLALGVGGAAGCGMLFGLQPALRAAHMDPIRAMK